MHDKEQPHCPKQVATPSACVTCADNAAELELFSHWQAKAATLPTQPPLHGEKQKVIEVETLSSTNCELDTES